jgi:25S rRNA (cytosine2278-C5)-methyltransferase
MSLYYDAATVLTGDELQGSLKSRIYNQNAGLKAKPAHVYALIAECAKYDTFLKEVIDNAGILAHEAKVCERLVPTIRGAAD